MDRAEQKLRLSDEEFKRNVGTTKPVFQMMREILQQAHGELHQFGGQPLTWSIDDKLLIALQYYREYRTMENIAIDFGCSKCTVFRAIRWVEEALSADGRLQLPGKKALQDGEPKTVAIDVTEQPVERPKKNRKCGIPARKSGTRSSPKS